MPGILGKKLGMTRLIKDDGSVTAITIIQCEPNIITQIKTTDKDGYNAVVLGTAPRKSVNKNKKFLFQKEFKFDSISEFEKGKTFDLSFIEVGDKISLTGTSKGKGFQGVMKRWNFAGGPASHGSHSKREPGSVGAGSKPGKIHKGKKLPGHMGNKQVTIKSTTVEFVDSQKNLIGIKGPVPGSINSFVQINKLS